VRAPAGGVLAPIDELGNRAIHSPLSELETWEWDLTAPADGPLSIIISSSDQRIVVLRNGQEVGRARAVIDEHFGTHVATLHRGEDGRSHWILVGVPGHSGEANHVLDAMVFERLRMPQGFYDILAKQVAEGTTVLVTSASLDASTSGQEMTLIAATE
jgi:rhodanese-related sulfurtransferase